MASSDPKPSSSTSANAPATAATAATVVVPERSYFETQRAALVGEIAVSLEHVLANINKLNRSLEGVIAVGNEFGSVEALWSQFENVMGRDVNASAPATGAVEGGGTAAAGVEKGSEKGGRGHEHENEEEEDDE